MKPRFVAAIAAKEFRDVLRDRRTLFFMMLLPVAVMPLLAMGATKFISRQSEAKRERVLKVAADESTRTTLRALQKSWHFKYDKTVGALSAKLGLDAAGGVEGLLDRLGGEGPGLGADGDGGLAAALSVARGMDADQRQLYTDLKGIDVLLTQTEFVAFDDLPEDGELDQGVEIPEDLPAPLADPRVALAIQAKTIDGALWLAPDAFVTLLEAEQPVDAYLLYDSSQSLSKELRERLAAFLEAANRQALSERLSDQGLSQDFAEPIVLEGANVATASRRLQAVLGGIIPYLLFAFCFFGAMYPALDVTAGEKERFTLETLLLAPVSRLEIATGKFLVVLVAAIVAALLSTTSMVLTVTKGILPAQAASAMDIQFQPLALVLTGSLMLPVAALYSALLLAVGLYARSFKEAQSYTVPLQFLLLLPMLVSFIPDVEAESQLAWIPFVNISLLMRELLKGNYLWGFYGITLASTLLLTVGGLLLCAALFKRESVLLRS